MTPVKILVVMTSLRRGGAELIAASLANAWWTGGAQVSVATVQPDADDVGLHPSIEVIRVAEDGVAGSPLKRLCSHVGSMEHLRRFIQIWSPDVIIAHGDRTNVLALLAARGLAVPVVVVEHNNPRLHPIGRFWGGLRRLTYPSAARIIGVSQGVSAVLAARYGLKVATIHNPVLIPETAEAPRLGGQAIVAMGRLTRQKGFDTLISAFASVYGHHPEATLTIWGRGEELARLGQQAEALDIASSVRFAGFTTAPDQALLSGSLFVLPSRWEGFGLALAEAMALGLPVIACDCPSGPAEIVRDGIDGLLVPPGDPSALAAAIGRVLDDPLLAARLAASAKEVRERFSLKHALARWQTLLDAVLTANGRSPSG